MQSAKLSNLCRASLASAFLFAANPAGARVTVVDGGVHMTVGGYCTPGQSGGSDCAPQAMPFVITIGGVDYDHFILNGNGTLTLGSGEINWTAVANQAPDFSSYSMPVFSPNNDNQTRYEVLYDPDGSDVNTRWAASFEATSNSLTAYWFPCSTAILCGKDSLPAEVSDEVPVFHTLEEMRALQQYGMFWMTLTNLGAGGLQLDYYYNTGVDPTGTYGFNLPGTASLQTIGTLTHRSWIFDTIAVRAVPEPATWMMMILGFAGMGLALRRRREAAHV